MPNIDIIIRAQNLANAALSQVNGQLAGLEKQSGFAARGLGGLGSVMGAGLKVAAGLSVVAVGAVGAAAVLATRDFGNFQEGMNEVFTLLPDISADAMSAMSEQVKDFSLEFKTLPEEVVPALYQALSAGVPQGNVFDFLEVANKAAVAGVSTLETSVDAISSVVNAYGADVISAAQTSDQMFTAVRLGKTTFDELGKSLFNVIPTAASLGVNFGDVQAALAAMTAQGVPTSVATTQLRQLLVELSKEGSKTADVFTQVAGKSFREFVREGGNTQDALKLLEQYAGDAGVGINDLFSSVEAGNAALGLTGAGAERFGSFLAEMGTSAGATDKAFATMNKGINRIKDQLVVFGKVALLELGERIAPAIETVGEWFSSRLPAAMDTFKGALDRIFGAIDALTGNAGDLFTVFEDGSSGLGTVLKSLGMTEESAYSLARSIATLGERVSAVVSPIADAIGRFVSWKDVLIALGVVVAAVVLPILAGIIASALPIIAMAAALIGAVALVRTAWENDWGGIRELVGGVVDAVLGAYRGFVDGTLTLPEAIGQAFSGIGAAISERLPGWIATLSGWGSAAWRWIVDATSVVLEKLGEWGTAIWQWVLDALPGWIATLSGWGSAAWQWIVDAVPVVLAKLGEWAGSLLGFLADKLPDFIAMIYGWATALISWIGDAVPKAIDALTDFIESLGKEGDTTGGSVFGETVAKWVGLLIDWVINDLIPKVGPAFLEFAGALLLALGKIALSLAKLAITLGAAIMDGIAAGVYAGAQMVADAVLNAAKAAWEAAKKFLGIGSPSRLFSEIGNQMMAGFSQGITGNASRVLTQVRDLVDDVSDAFAGMGTIPGFATGTSFAPGGLALVGERGPELVHLPRGSRVDTAEQTQRMMGGDTYYITQNIHSTDPVRAAQEAMRGIDYQRRRGQR